MQTDCKHADQGVIEMSISLGEENVWDTKSYSQVPILKLYLWMRSFITFIRPREWTKYNPQFMNANILLFKILFF